MDLFTLYYILNSGGGGASADADRANIITALNTYLGFTIGSDATFTDIVTAIENSTLKNDYDELAENYNYLVNGLVNALEVNSDD